MKIIEMTTEEAINVLKESKGKVVMVAMQDLEHEEDMGSFFPHLKSECENIIGEAKTIVLSTDHFIRQLDLFTEKQLDLRNIQAIGYRKIILMKYW